MTTPRLLVLGNANVDLVLGEVDGWPAVGTEIMVERAETRAGGSAGNTALALTGLGVPHLFISTVGNDANGAFLRGAFNAASCDWLVDSGETTLTVGVVHRGGDRAFFTTPGHLQRATVEDLLARAPAAPAGGSIAILSGGFLMPRVDAGTDELLAALAARGWRTAIDPGWPVEGWTDAVQARMRQWLARADIALLNEDEVRGLTGMEARAGAHALAAEMRAGQMLVVKRGAGGATLYLDGQACSADAPAVTVIDTVGAGDTFNAAYIAGLVAGRTPADALAAGTATAARAISTFPRRYA